MRIINHNHPKYKDKWQKIGASRYNGAYYYSREITKFFIPAVETDRNWITVNIPGHGCDHAIFFIHNNLHPENYNWLLRYKDLILVCGLPETCEKVAHLGTPVYLPLSIDTQEVEAYRVEEKTKKICFAGRPSKRLIADPLPVGTDFLENMPRKQFLMELVKYKYAYAVGRCALEAKVLGCKLKSYDPRFKDTKLWKVVDSRDAAKKLQKLVDKIDGIKR